jgi:ketosteroid isomerase-like protein
MASQRVQAVDSVIEAWNAGTHVRELFTADAVFDLTRWAFDVPTAWTVKDPEAHKRVESFIGVWEDFRCDIHELTDVGRAVLAVVHLTARGRVSGVKLSDRFALVFDFDDGRINRFTVYPDESQARAAAGI